MKTLIKFPAIMLGLVLLLTGTTQIAKAQYDDVSLQTFYDELSPYGTWINDPEYGYVWRPDVDQADFRPYYSNGRWAMTEYGNTWVSNYDWGWAPFHYGRWMYNRYNNWVWLPDTTWGPAWVDWRSGGGQYGWAPMGPSINININIGRRYVTPDFCWNFIPVGHIYYNSYPRYYSGRNRVYIQNTVIINNTYVRNNRTYYTGPRIDDVRRATNQNVTVYNVSRTSRSGGNRIENNTVNVYAPRPTRGSDNANAAPRQAIRGSVTRDRIERNSAVTRESRGRDNNVYSNNGRGERTSDRTFENNTTRDRGNSAPTREGRVDSNNERNTDRGGLFGRSRERSDAGSTETRTTSPYNQPRVERSRERSESSPSRSSSSEGRTQQATPQRSMERTERSQPQRTERVERSQRSERPQSSGSSSRSSGGSERSSRSESGGRPGRG
ncbi:DUF6600 domain-containing protein [Pedobacter xixiisoli]|uniref:YXWGXW repeat-containing protein n=1 Tax=Pedobacter xixiisoli TaxID=1476464 RepID=A0A286AD13_9SPHI|nr:DUF6600 domain-containing protein [Pedobacter xixiisoli]SOD19799.1 hypothetical protein SAMN06297358_3505 [Pedobacter xixiisoli]